ncbi:MAG TPA: hypothetical protein VKF60_13575 [Myxococcota bacterium]|nr:hypothetical protein [Myxococcota bacterium]
MSAADALLLADLSGECGLLGAYQRAGRSGIGRELRGLCGGRSAFAGEGVSALFAVIPEPRAWLREESALSGARLLNRLVRGLLAGLTPIGVGASYPGRDFVAVEGRRVAQLSLSRSERGACLFQALIGRARPYTTAEPAPEFRGLPPLPPAGALGVEAETLATALARGFEARFGLELERAELSREDERAISATELEPLVDPGLAGLRAGAPVATPIGELEAHVALGADGALERVRLRGDWIAAPGDVRVLEDALVGVAPDCARARELCARWLGAPAHLVVGVTDPAAIAEAIARAAGSESSASPG